MSTVTRFRSGSAQLLQHVLDQPRLVTAVRDLPTPALVRLINRVGLEDAGELIALLSTQQLCQVFDAELWRAAEPGADETFRPERFALYLRLLFEAGDAFAVERLLALPRQLLTLAFHRLLLVIDIDALTVRFGSAGRFFDDGMDRVVRAIDDAQFEEWEEFRLIARDASAFDDVWNALLALDREDHALVRRLIERCCDMDGELIEESGLYAVLNEEEALAHDVAGERSDRRAAAGHVAPADARAFLELARRDIGDDSAARRDAIARAYFRELAPDPIARGDAGPRPEASTLLAVVQQSEAQDDTLAPRRKGRRLTLMAESLLALRERSIALHTERTEELGFLANVLVAGGRHDGRTYRPVEAIECALSVCSIGLIHACAGAAIRRAPSAAQGAKLLSELTADRLFRIGTRVLRRELGDHARAQLAEGREPVESAELAALAEPEPWLTGSLAAADHRFIANLRDLRRARRFLAREVPRGYSGA